MSEIAPKEKEGRSPGLPLTDDECRQIKERIKDYRVGQAQLDCLQRALAQYTGTHCFHNFTKGALTAMLLRLFSL